MGSGIRSFDIFVSVDNQVFSIWLNDAITAVSTDPGGGTVTYSLLGDAGRFATDPLSGEIRVANQSLLESDTQYVLRVVASDGELSTMQEFSVFVKNVAPLSPNDFDPAPNVVRENAPSGTQVGLIAYAIDPGGWEIQYSLTDDAGGRFAIDGELGIVRVANGSLFDYESATSHTIRVRATKSPGLRLTHV